MERPSAVRQRILDDHEALRVLLAEVEELVRRTRTGDTAAAEALPERGRALRARFLDHLALEDAHLVPALRAADAWGEERAQRVAVEHAEQRERMQALLEHMESPTRSMDQLAEELASLVADLRADMEGEEQAVLSENLLRDDVVSIDLEAG
jgi:hemerythrin-like domain-containing protein